MKSATKFKLPESENYLQLELPSFRLMGRGIAGVESVYTLLQFDITFDTGRAPYFSYQRDHLALTHFHADHGGSLAYYVGMRCLYNLSPLNIIVPSPMKERARHYLESIKAISDSDLKYVVIGANEGVELKKNIYLKPLKSDHCTESIGYGIERKKKKLKNQFQGHSPETLIEKKTKGVIVDEEMSELVFAYSGDSTGNFFKTEARKAKVLLMECSFFGDADVAKVRHYGHTHLDDWIEWADRIESETVIMTHTSQRYSRDEIKSYCRKGLPHHLLKRLILFR